MDRKEKYHLWKKRMEDFEASGQTIQEWISIHEEINQYQFHYWRRKFKAENIQESRTIENRWTSIDVPVLLSSTTIEVRVNDVSIHIPEDASEAHIHRIFRVLRHV